jgi:CxxC motif-containing protein (DUF1111 family)
MQRSYRARKICPKTVGRFGTILSLAAVFANATAAQDKRAPRRAVTPEYVKARALFEKTWTTESSSHGGDGLGPLFNESSCVACHHLGGTGGAGGKARNVKVLSTNVGPVDPARAGELFKGELEALHPGLKNRSSIVLHKFSTDLADQQRLTDIQRYCTVQTRDDLVTIGFSERNTPALFGAGLIDTIPDEDLIHAASRVFPDFPWVTGRISRLRDGQIGRFGWKGQTATLREFVLAACANELGLEVPGHHQTTLAPSSSFDAAALKLDMDSAECELLTRFVAKLPRPVYAPVVDGSGPMRGREVFAEIGCATCHAPSLGRVDGLYSDLLLHDLGDGVSAFGSGYGFSGWRGSTRDSMLGSNGKEAKGEAQPNEWRTPPLWGVADSGPYLHDGRAKTLDEAIRLHGGEAESISNRYVKLDRADRQCLLAFLHSLRAPKAAGHLSWFGEISPVRGVERV